MASDTTTLAAPDPIDAFIARWQGVTASELASAQSFVIDLCGLLGLPAPHPTAEQDYMFERPVTFRHGDGGSSAGRIDCYRRGCFVLEAKKLKVPKGPQSAGAGDTAGGSKKGYDDALLRARSRPRTTPAPCPPARAARPS
jgi:hypothetical protein